MQNTSYVHKVLCEGITCPIRFRPKALARATNNFLRQYTSQPGPALPGMLNAAILSSADNCYLCLETLTPVGLFIAYLPAKQ